jgi:hypothetical protein
VRSARIDRRNFYREIGEENGAMGIRTPDLLNAIEALYQLSYDPDRKDGE